MFKTKETEEEIIVRKRREYKEEYIRCLNIGEECESLRDLDAKKLRNSKFWEDKIQKYMNRAQIALYNYDLLDPDILKQIGIQYLKEMLIN